MHKMWVLTGLALGLAACGKDDGAEQASNSAQGITVETIGGNDITAIDAATSSDANMAADIEYNVDDLNALEENGDAGALEDNEA